MAELRISGREPLAPTLVDVLEQRARVFGGVCAYRYLWEDGAQTTLTFGELERRARGVAAAIQPHCEAGQRALLVFPPGLDFITAFLGCLSAGVVAVPATYPKPRRPMPRLSAIAKDCQPTIALTVSQTLASLDRDRLSPEVQSLKWIAVDSLPEDAEGGVGRPIASDGLAFLQYTSGSTSEPKGVMVSHENLIYNLEMIRQGFDIEPASPGHPTGAGLFWLPTYHDMGLVGGILESLYVGGSSVLMSPAAFLQRPERWLKAISQYKAAISGAPNFGYELCVRRITSSQCEGLDLSSWRVAFCGAEPIRPGTIKEFAEAFEPFGFRESAFYPCYGLAEATLLAAGGQGPKRPAVIRLVRSKLLEHSVVEVNGEDRSDAQELVGCGNALLDQRLVIADPEKMTQCPEGRVGEIWLKGRNISCGYWNRKELNRKTFRARLADTGERPFLRTGDLGFVRGDQLFVTGRVKDLIIIRGRNYYPHDIELTVEQADPALLSGGGATFSIERDDGERLVVVHEVARVRGKSGLREIIPKIRSAIAKQHELDTFAVVLIRRASLPRTTSGKVQRNLCRRRYLDGRLKVLADWESVSGAARGAADARESCSRRTRIAPQDEPLPVPSEETRLSDHEIDRLAERIESHLLAWLRTRSGLPVEQVDRDTPFLDLGVDSLAAVEMSRELEDWLKIPLTPIIAWNYPTAAAMSLHLARQAGGARDDSELEAPDAAALEDADDFEQVLAEIESLSESEAGGALDQDDEPGVD